MDYKQRFCQRILTFIFLFLLLNGCSGIGGSDTLEVTERVKAKAWWLNGPERMTPRDRSNRPPTHAFFDFVPFAKIEDRELNVILTTLKGSEFNYRLDTHSGKIYRSHDYCPQNDVWLKYQSTLFKPPYSEAVVPRVIDQLGFPQKVLVFSDTKYFFDYGLEANQSHRVRIVGGVIEQYCAIYPCDITEKWLSRMILIAVNPDDLKLRHVRTIPQLKKKVNWSHALAFMQNGDGRAYADKKELPAYRVVGEIGSKKAMTYALTKGHMFSFDELKGMRKNCWKLYDYVWKSAKLIRSGKGKNKQKIVEDFKMEAQQKLLKLYESNVVKADSELASDDGMVVKRVVNNNFATFFRYFHKKYGKSFNMCRRFVTHSNMKDDLERHWFFTYLSLFMELEKHGYIFKCDKRGWVKNIVLVDGSYSLSTDEELLKCSTLDLDYAFDSGVVLMSNLRKSVTYSHSEYLEYDNGEGGSHQLLNSLIHKRGKKLACDVSYQKRKYQREIIPYDVSWKPFSKARLNKRKRASRKDIIE